MNKGIALTASEDYEVLAEMHNIVGKQIPVIIVNVTIPEHVYSDKDGSEFEIYKFELETKNEEIDTSGKVQPPGSKIWMNFFHYPGIVCVPDSSKLQPFEKPKWHRNYKSLADLTVSFLGKGAQIPQTDDWPRVFPGNIGHIRANENRDKSGVMRYNVNPVVVS